MKEKITLPNLINLLALDTGETKKQAEDFIKAYFSALSHLLEQSDSIKIKGFGTFKTITVNARKSVDVTTGEENEIPSHKKIVFIPNKEIASDINEPFEMFETTEIDDNSFANDNVASIAESDQQQDDIDAQESKEAATALSQEESIETVDYTILPQSNDKEEELINEKDTINSESQPEISQKQEFQPDEVHSEDNPIQVDSSQVITTQDNPTQDNPPQCYQSKNKKKYGFLKGFIVGFVAAAFVAGICFLGIYFLKEDSIFRAPLPEEEVIVVDAIEVEDTESEDKSDSALVENDIEEESSAANKDNVSEKAESVPTQPSDKKIVDTITRTRYLTTMAREYYGSYHLWPYIYKENEKILGHPDRIRPGTKVVVPDLKKYGVDPKNPEDIAKAKKMGAEIYARYK